MSKGLEKQSSQRARGLAASREAIRQADRAWILGEFAADFAGGGIPTEADAYKLARIIAAEAQPGDVVALLSNGNLTTLADAIAGALQQRFTE